MGVVTRQSVQSTLILYFGVALGYFNLVWLFPKVLSTEEIGLIRFLASTSLLLVPFVQLGVGNITVRFFPYFSKPDQHRRFVFLMFMVPLVGFTLLFSGLFFFKSSILSAFAKNSPQIAEYYLLLLPFTFILTYYSVLAAYSRTLLKIVVPNLIREVFIRLLILAIAVLYFYSLIQLEAFLYLYVGCYGAGLALVVIYVNSQRKLRIKADTKIVKARMFREVSMFGLFSILAGAGSVVVANVDVIMLSAMEGLSKTGIYSVAFFIGVVIELPRKSITQITGPIVAKAWKEGDMVHIKRLYKKSSSNLFLSSSLLFLLIWLNVDNIFTIIPNGAVYKEGIYVVFFIGIAKVFDLLMGINGVIIANSDLYKYNFVSIIILAVVAVITNYYFIPIYGITGAALASAISIVIFNTFKFIILWSKTQMQPFTKTTLLILLISLITFTAGYYMPSISNTWVDMFVRSSIIVILFGGMAYLLNLSEEARNLMKTVLRRLGIKN